jgi:hypothetical protein
MANRLVNNDMVGITHLPLFFREISVTEGVNIEQQMILW